MPMRFAYPAFLGDAPALVLGHVTERAHVVQSVCQFDEHDTHILAHGEFSAIVITDPDLGNEMRREFCRIIFTGRNHRASSFPHIIG